MAHGPSDSGMARRVSKTHTDHRPLATPFRVHIKLGPRDLAEAKRQAARAGMPYTTWLRDEIRRVLSRERRIFKFRFPPSYGAGGVVVVCAESIDEARRLVIQFAHNYRGTPSITGDWIVSADAEEFQTDASRVLAWAESAA